MKRSSSTAELPVFRPLVPEASDDREPPVAPAAEEQVPAPLTEANAVEHSPMAFPGPFAFVPRPTAMQDGDFESGSASSTSDMQDGLGQSVGTSFFPGLNPGQLHGVLVNDAGGSTVAAASTGFARRAVNDDNPRGLPPLILAAEKGRLAEVELLLKDPAVDINQAHQRSGWTALMAATYADKSDVVKCLLAAGAKVNLVGGQLRRTALMEAAFSGHIEVVKALLVRKDIALDEIDAKGFSALYLAANRNEPEVVVYLLAAGANVNLGCGKQRQTALMAAVFFGHIEVLKTLLISKDIALEKTDVSGHSALYLAVGLNKPDVVECLLAAEAKVNLGWPDCLARTGLARQVDAENLVADLVSAGWLMPLAQAIVTSWKSTLAALEAEPLAIAPESTMQQINQSVVENTERKAPPIFAQAMQRELAAQTLVAALRTWIGEAQSVEGLDLLFQVQCDQLKQYCEQIASAS